MPQLLHKIISIVFLLIIFSAIFLLVGGRRVAVPVSAANIETFQIVTPPLTYYLYLPALMRPDSLPEPVGPGACLTAEEFELVDLINQYRNDNGLAAVSLSKSLTEVAQWHVIDLHENEPDTGTDHGLACNMHSWSDQGVWSPVCYTSDHRFASGMWGKPGEITSNVYPGNGYENAYGSSGQATAANALDSWQGSAGHNAVILETGVWSGKNWPAMGVGIYQQHAVLWFGDDLDPQGTVTEQCDVYEGRPLGATAYPVSSGQFYK